MKSPKHQTQLKAAIRQQIKHLNRYLTLIANVDEQTYALAREVFTTDAAVAQWLSEPAPSLWGGIPFLHMRSAKGRKAVVESLKRIVHGVPM